MVGRLEPVSLRDVWAKEARDFTTWLSNNLDILSEYLGLELTALETEKSVGPFSADILAEDRDGFHVVIENQIGKTDHDHLGKVITYLSNLDAKTAIWIASDPRPEHVRAIEYLNEVSPEDTKFHLSKSKLLKLGVQSQHHISISSPAQVTEVKYRGEIIKEFAEKDQRRLEFFRQLLDLSNSKTTLFKNVSPAGYQSWLNAGAGKAGLAWAYVIRRNDGKAELFLWVGCSRQTLNDSIVFCQKKKKLSSCLWRAIGMGLQGNRKQHYIRSWTKIGGIDNEDQWPAIQNDLVNRMIRLEKA